LFARYLSLVSVKVIWGFKKKIKVYDWSLFVPKMALLAIVAMSPMFLKIG